MKTEKTLIDKKQYEQMKSRYEWIKAQNEKMFTDLGLYRSLGSSAISIHCQIDELRDQVSRAMDYDYYLAVAEDLAYWINQEYPMGMGRDAFAADETFRERAVDFCVKECGPESSKEALLNLCSNRKTLHDVIVEDGLSLNLDDDVACDAAIRAHIARRDWPKICKNIIGG